MVYVAFLVFTFFILVLAFYQWQFLSVFYPKYYREDILDDNFEMLSILTTDGIELEGVIYKPKGYHSVMLFYAGRGNDAVAMIKRLSLLYPDIAIITFNYRSYGKSGGVVNEKNIFEDGLYIAEMVKKHYGEFYILGFSLGASVASFVASKTDTKSLFLVGAFKSIISLAKQKYRFIPSMLIRYRFESDKFLQHTQTDVYLFLSKDDEIVDVQNSRGLKGCINNLKYYCELDNVMHKELLWHEAVVQKIKGVIEQG